MPKEKNILLESIFVDEKKHENMGCYFVKDNKININNSEYDTKLEDGKYILRKLTPIECERLQNLPDNYTYGTSDSQRY